ncbi:pectin lyase-like protein [Gymnopus androsaceus JB14]|uniref:Pectin lyase-like protein n=1 Tax=Gymnopus androsaceus JB14 TaxID=1447944 RepID=A0A6A4HBZ3_9AGAR|nr:pectin lyase-like protein [Gymnopus androsaceus JB14]
MLSLYFTGAFLVLGLQVQRAFAFIECNVLNYGAVADNSTDLGPALTAAWEKCVIPQVTTTVADNVLLYVPAGTTGSRELLGLPTLRILLRLSFVCIPRSTVTFNDAANWNLHIAGNIYLPFNPDLTGTMITFENCQNILFNGPGAIYGNGYLVPSEWRLSQCTPVAHVSSVSKPATSTSQVTSHTELMPIIVIAISIEITEITLYNSPQFHVTIIGNNNKAHDMAIHADHIGETDGFDISGNNNQVYSVTVENGGMHPFLLVVSSVNTVQTSALQSRPQPMVSLPRILLACGLLDATLDLSALVQFNVDVQNVFYSDVSISNSDAGVMIKSYPNCQGTVKNITYTGFTLDAAAYPIYISAFWEGGTTDTGTLSVTDVTFENFKGTGTPTRPAVLLDCNKATPCKEITFTNIDITNTKANQYTNACGAGVSGLNGC